MRLLKWHCNWCMLLLCPCALWALQQIKPENCNHKLAAVTHVHTSAVINPKEKQETNDTKLNINNPAWFQLQLRSRAGGPLQHYYCPVSQLTHYSFNHFKFIEAAKGKKVTDRQQQQKSKRLSLPCWQNEGIEGFRKGEWGQTEIARLGQQQLLNGRPLVLKTGMV